MASIRHIPPFIQNLQSKQMQIYRPLSSNDGFNMNVKKHIRFHITLLYYTLLHYINLYFTAPNFTVLYSTAYTASYRTTHQCTALLSNVL